jgi:hypothetical protein
MATPDGVMRVILLLVVLGLADLQLLLWRFQIKHPAEWTLLGAPKLFSSPRPSRIFFRFIRLRGEFRKLDDPLLNAMVIARHVINFLIVVGFACLVLVTLPEH